MAMAVAATKATAEGNGCNECNGIVDDSGRGKGKGRGSGNACGEGSGIGCCEGNEVGNNGFSGSSSGDNNGCSYIGSGCSDGDGRGKGMALAVTTLLASGSGKGITTDVCNAILPRYTDAVDAGSGNHGNCMPTIDGGNIEWWVTDFDNGVQHACEGVNYDSRERAATSAAAWRSGCGGGNVLDPTPLSGVDVEDANNNDKYSNGN